MEKRKFKLNGIAYYTILFVLVFFIVFIPFMKRGLTMIWSIDGIGQYYPAFLYIGQFIRDFFTSGKFMSFDLRIAMGEDVFSTLNYYGLGDPLNIIAVFSNESNGILLFQFMFFLRLYLSGLSFYFYCRYMRLNERLIVPGAFMYMCSGYVFCACMMYIEFLSPLVYFPLLLLSIEKFFKEKKWWLITLVSAYAALCTMYLFYYAALCLIPYAIIRTWFLYKNNFKKLITQCLLAGLSALIGVAVTFPVLFPSLKGMLSSQRAGGDILGIVTSLTNYRQRRYNTVQFFKGFLPTYDEGVYFFHEIPLFSYMAILLLFVLFFYFKNRSSRNRQLLISVIIGCIAFTMPISNILFSGFVQGFTYDRWIFMLEFLFALVFVCTFSDFINLKFPEKKDMAYTVVTALVIINVCTLGVVLYSHAGKEFTDTFMTKDDVRRCIDSPLNYSDVIKDDKGLYRVSNDSLTNINGRPENVQMINDYYGLTFWLSIVNPNVQRIADTLPKLNSEGFVDQRMFGLENDKVKESLAGVKYYMRKDNDDFPDDYELKETVNFYGDEWEIYENPDALPLCYAFERSFFDNELKELYYKGDESVIKNALAAENVEYDNDTFTCTINLPSESAVVLAVPYSSGWRVTIDDKEAKVYNSDIYYMTVYADKGSHTIVYKYNPYVM